MITRDDILKAQRLPGFDLSTIPEQIKEYKLAHEAAWRRGDTLHMGSEYRFYIDIEHLSNTGHLLALLGKDTALIYSPETTKGLCLFIDLTTLTHMRDRNVNEACFTIALARGAWVGGLCSNLMCRVPRLILDADVLGMCPKCSASMGDTA